GAFVMVVNPTFPARTVPEFIAYAKTNPDKINMASSGIGSPSHVSGELFRQMAGVEMLHVLYRGGPPAPTDVIAGQVQVMFVTMSSSIEYIGAGARPALPAPAARRSQALPEFRPRGDFSRGYGASQGDGVGVPKTTPADIVDKLNKEINAGLADPKIKAKLTDLSGTAFG